MSCEFLEMKDFDPDYKNMQGVCKKKTFVEGACEKKEVCAKPVEKTCNKWGATYWISFILGFILLAVIIGLLLAAAKPSWVQNTNADGQPDGTVNAGKVVLWAVVVSLFIMLIVWIVLALLWGM